MSFPRVFYLHFGFPLKFHMHFSLLMQGKSLSKPKRQSQMITGSKKECYEQIQVSLYKKRHKKLKMPSKLAQIKSPRKHNYIKDSPRKFQLGW